MDEGGTTLKTGIYCRGCGYDLRESNLRCPECGRAFDRGDPRTIHRSPHSHAFHCWGRRIVLLMLIVTLPPALAICWLALGWRAEQRHIVALERARWAVTLGQSRYSWLAEYLPGQWALLTNRTSRASLNYGGYVSEEDARHLGALTYLTEIRLDWFAEGTDKHLGELGRLSRLEQLRIGGRGITDDGLSHLALLRQMRELHFEVTSIRGSGLGHLRGMTQLQALHLGGSPLSDGSLAHLGTLNALRRLGLGNTPITDAGLRHLASLTQLQELWLTRTKVTDDGMSHVAGMQSLETLALNGTAVTDAGLAHLRSLPSLRYLYLGDTRITQAGMKRLQQAIPGLMIPDQPTPPPASQPSTPADNGP